MSYRIKIENFRSVSSTEIVLNSGLNVMIGPNGAGKTNLLKSIIFIRDVLGKGVAMAIAKAGGPRRSYYRDSKEINIRIQFEYGTRIFKNRKRRSVVMWDFQVMQTGTEKIATITKENLNIWAFMGNWNHIFQVQITRNIASDSTKFIYKFPQPDNIGKDLFSAIYDGAANKKKINELILSRFKMIEKMVKGNGDISIMRFLGNLDSNFFNFLALFSSMEEYNIVPERARASTEQLPYAKMESDGYGLSEVINALLKKNFHKLLLNDDIPDNIYNFMPRYYYSANRKARDSKRFSSVMDDINRELSSAVKPIKNVSIEIDQSNGKRFIVFNTDNQKFYPNEVSDGTIKWLCILTGIYVGFSKIFLLEEPENFLHPWMQQKLIQIMREQAKENDIIFLLTSHSTTLLNAVYPEEMVLVIQQETGTVTSKIDEQEEIINFLKTSDFGLGDLWVSGGLGAIPD